MGWVLLGAVGGVDLGARGTSVRMMAASERSESVTMTAVVLSAKTLVV